MPVRTITIGSRTVTVYDDGDPDGPAILYHHGTPGAGGPYAPWIEDARARGARLISYDRPDYGNSSPAPGRTVADAAADSATIMDALDIERFVTWGISGGGPHTLACAALLRGRVTAAACLGGVATFDAPGLNFFRGMGQDNLVEFGLAMPINFAGGVGGWLDDDFAFLNSPGFALDTIEVPVLIAHGHQDQFVPVDHGDWLGRVIPGAELWILADEGHLSLMTDVLPDVHGWLLERAELT